MLKRIVSTLGLWTLLLVLLYFFGATGAIWTITAIAVLTLREFYSLMKHMGYDPFDKLATFLGAAVVLGPYYLARYHVQTVDLIAFAVVAFFAASSWWRTPSGSSSMRPIVSKRTRFFTKVFVSRFRKKSSKPISAETSSGGRLQFSAEKA